jgi:ABC-type phosphate transport system substrate-binding protein
MLHQKSAPFLRWALASALITTAMPLAGSLPLAPLMAQSPLPPLESVAQGTTVKLANSSTRTTDISNALKQAFVAKFAGTQIISTTQPSAIALQSVLDGKVDLAALSRPLTAAEKAQGLVAVPIAREKIAIIINAASPFNGSLSLKQFADIFRGQITNWSQIGGPAGAIRVIDRPDNSDLRQSFRTYSAFNIGTLQTGGNATQLNDDNTTAVVNALGPDGIGYAPISQIRRLSSVRALPLHNTLPDNAKYPFSQSYLYVFKGPNPNPAAAAFLGFATAPSSQQLANTALAAGQSAAVNPPPTQGEVPTAAGKLKPTPGNKATVGQAERADKPPAGNLNAGSNGNSTSGKAEGRGTAFLPSLGGDRANVEGGNDTWGGLGWLWNLAPLLLLPLIWWIFRGMWQGDDQNRLGIPEIDAERPEDYPPLPDDRFPDRWLADAADPAIDPMNKTVPVGTNFDFNAPGATAGGSTAAGFTVPDWNPPAENADSSRPNWQGNADGAGETETSDLMQKATGSLSNLFGSATGAGSGAIAAQMPVTADEDERARVAKEASEVDPSLSSDRPLLDYSEPSPTLDFDPLDWMNFPEAGTSEPLEPTLPTATPVEPGSSGAFNLLDPIQDFGGATAATGTGAWSSFLERDDAVGAVYNDVIDPDAGITGHAVVNDFDDLGDLTDGVPNVRYENYIALMPRGAHWAYAYWSVTEDLKQALQLQGGRTLVLRLYDVTSIDFTVTPAHSMQQFDCGDLAQDWHIPIPVSDRDYLVELGYTTNDNRWLLLARSPHIHISADGVI